MLAGTNRMTTRTVISLQGPQAVGKTTAARRLQRKMNGVHFDFEDPYPVVLKRNRMGLDINTEDGFIENQRLFIEAECERYNHLPPGIVIMDRGPEDTECFTLVYPKTIGADWDIESALSMELSKLRACKVDHILYLTASPQTLLQRKEVDVSRRRGAFDIKRFEFFEKWFREHTQAEFIDVSNSGIEEVEEMVHDWICAKVNSQQAHAPDVLPRAGDA